MDDLPLSIRRAILAHLVAVFFAAFSLIVLIPHPEWWAHLPGAAANYNFAMQYAGPLHIVLGAIAVFLLTRHTLGPRRAAWFAAIAIPTSLCFELLGTGTGWPFGNYRYLSGLGFKVLGHVPFSIPLSWYYVAVSGYGLALHLLARHAPGLSDRARDLGSVALGVWLLMAWDLVLDPAMAHPDMPLTFWVWEQRGAYLGMPLINLAGWVACGFVMIGGTRLAWGAPPRPEALPAVPLFAVYAGNVLFGAAICASVGLWGAIALGAVAALLPAVAALWGGTPSSAPGATAEVP